MNKKSVLFLISILSFTLLSARTQDPVLMKINNHPVAKSEFEYLYHKNNTSSQQSKDEYLKLFVDYKLKVEEALTQQLDTLVAFTTEYGNYKYQLTQPYLNDTITQQVLAKQIYDRMGENLEVSHILIRLPHDKKMLPKDTVEAYEKAIMVRNELLAKNPKSFEEAAVEYSEDQYSIQSERPGYLGWSTSMMYVSSFEDGMYATPVNSISMPVRSMFGYHLIKVHDRRKDPGKFNISHIMFSYPNPDPSPAQVDSVKKIADEIYAKLKSGGDYAELCKEYSSDKASSENGGNMGWIQTGVRLPQSFLDAVYTLKNAGDMTAPITTPFGFHIIKLEEKADRDSWEEMKHKIIGRINNSDLSDKMTLESINRLSKEFKYDVDKDAYKSMQALANQSFPLDSAYVAVTSADNRTLLTVGNKKYTVADFTKEMEKNESSAYNISTDFLEKELNMFILSCLKDAYIASLEDKNPEYKNLLREYHDGILLFNIMTKEVWNKAAQDEDGLADHFNKNRTKYQWDAERFKGDIVYCKDEETMEKAKKIAEENKEALNLDEILKPALNTDSTSVVFSKKGVWAKGENKYVDAEIFGADEKPEPVKSYPFYFVQGRLINAPEEYKDIKGLVISEYQEVREKEWMQALREKYSVEINKNVLKAIK